MTFNFGVEETLSEDIEDAPQFPVDWGNDELFFTGEYTDETSRSDPKGVWQGGGEYYQRTWHVRVPIALKDAPELCDAFIDMMCERFNEQQGFWVD